MGEDSGEDPDNGLQDAVTRRELSIACLGLGILLTGILGYEVAQGFVYGRHGVVYRASNPQLFWSIVGLYSIGILMAVLVFILSLARTPE